MRSRLQSIILDDLCEQIIDSEHKTAPIQLSGIPYVRTPNVKNTRLILDDAHRVSEETYKEWTKRIEPKPYDIILCREAPVGDSAMILPNQKICLGQRTVLIRANKEKIYPKYLLFLLNSPNVKHELLSNSGGTHVDHLNMKDIRSLNVEIFHSYDEQKIIGDLLFNLNSLIYSKEKQNQILEKTIQTIFKSWFVDFDGVTEFDDSELGKIPKGWQVGTFGEFAEIINGFAFKSEDYTDEGIFLLRTRNFSKTGYVEKDEAVYLPLNFYEKFENLQLKKFDILLVMVGASVGNQGFVTSNALPALQNQNMWNIRAKTQDHQLFLRHLVRKIVQENMGTATGSARDFFRKDYFRNIKFVEPSYTIITKFDNIITQFYKKLDNNILEIKILEQTKELLLPKLMSGEIRV